MFMNKENLEKLFELINAAETILETTYDYDEDKILKPTSKIRNRLKKAILEAKKVRVLV